MAQDSFSNYELKSIAFRLSELERKNDIIDYMEIKIKFQDSIIQKQTDNIQYFKNIIIEKNNKLDSKLYDSFIFGATTTAVILTTIFLLIK